MTLIEFIKQYYDVPNTGDTPQNLIMGFTIKRNMVIRMIFSVFKQKKILNSIVSFITINMVNMLTPFKKTAKMLLHNITMLSIISSWIALRIIRKSKMNISLRINPFPSIPMMMFFTKFMRKFFSKFRMIYLNIFRFTTKRTILSNLLLIRIDKKFFIAKLAKLFKSLFDYWIKYISIFSKAITRAIASSLFSIRMNLKRFMATYTRLYKHINVISINPTHCNYGI